MSDASSIPAISDQTTIPGNQALIDLDRLLRVEELFAPYHQAVERQIGAMLARDIRPILVSVHSFTPVFQGVSRPWHVGVLWNNDPDLAQLVIELLGQFDDWTIGDNQPYHACEPLGYSVETHAVGNGLADILFEVRQDLIAEPAGQQLVADRLTAVLQQVLALTQGG